MSTPIRANLKDCFMKGDGNKGELYNIASHFGRSLVSKEVKHHQLRNLLDFVIWAKQSHTGGPKAALGPTTMGRVATLRPRLAYMAARMERLNSLRQQMDELLREPKAIQTGADLTRLYDFAAALVAFHKYFEKQN